VGEWISGRTCRSKGLPKSWVRCCSRSHPTLIRLTHHAPEGSSSLPLRQTSFQVPSGKGSGKASDWASNDPLRARNGLSGCHVGVIYSRFESLHCGFGVFACRLDVTGLCNRDVAVTQDSLNYLIVYAQANKVGRRTTRAVPCSVRVDGLLLPCSDSGLSTELADLKRRQNDPAQQVVGIDLIAGPVWKRSDLFSVS
jgi:hypothetical protein